MMNPLSDSPPAEVRLANSPIHRVLVVAHFPAILKISQEQGIIGFQDRIRKAYPLLHREQEVGVQFQVAPNGDMLPPQQILSNLWRFVSQSGKWRVTLTTESVSLETYADYVSRDDFLERFEFVTDVLISELEPSSCNRLGIRYVNALDASDMSVIAESVRPGLRSLSDTEIVGNISGSAHSVTFEVPEGDLFTRWGLLPSGASHDPTMLTPSAATQWYLDLDCYSESAIPFDKKDILHECRKKTERIYAFFRWAMMPEFIEKNKDA